MCLILNHVKDKLMSDKKTIHRSLMNFSKPIQGKKTDIQNPTLWEFPMNYPLSIIGHEGEKESLLNEVKLILNGLFPDFDLASLVINPSRTGRFLSVRVNLYLTHAQQVNDLYQALDEAKTVRTVL